MAAALVSDELWAILEPHIPVKPRRSRNPGRKPLPNRACLAGILWEMLPQEMGSGMICWQRLRDWKEAGVWQKVHETLLNQLRAADAIDFERALVDSGTVRAIGGQPGAPRYRFDELYADRAYDSEPDRVALREIGTTPHIPNAAPNTAAAWARSVGPSNARSAGCTSSDACVCVANGDWTSTTRSCRSAVS